MFLRSHMVRFFTEGHVYPFLHILLKYGIPVRPAMIAIHTLLQTRAELIDGPILNSAG